MADATCKGSGVGLCVEPTQGINQALKNLSLRKVSSLQVRIYAELSSHNICGDLGHPHDPLVGLGGFNSVSPAAVCTAAVLHGL